MTPPPWLDDSDDPPSPPAGRARRAPFVVIGYSARKQVWRAIWIDDEGRGKFQGTRKEAIAWARQRCDDIRVTHGPGGEDITPRQLGPDEE
ncbi:MAG: hypothetical protein JO144_01085 [Actinobacteria bacterium]|nr:hypothetical protein [Actinomycetota bacterium]